MVALLGLVLLTAVACGSPAATPENTPPPAATEAPALPTATTVPQRSAQATDTPEPPPAASAEADRPTLTAGVIWLDSPLDPVKSGWVANQSGMSENLFRLSATTLSPEPWLAMDAVQVDPLTWEITLRTDVKFHNGAAMDAQAVKASLERTLRLSPASAEIWASAPCPSRTPRPSRSPL